MNKGMLFIAIIGLGLFGLGSTNAEDAAGQAAGEHFTGKERIVVLPGGIQMTFVWIEPGTFQMGARLPEDEWLTGLEELIALDRGEVPVHGHSCMVHWGSPVENSLTLCVREDAFSHS